MSAYRFTPLRCGSLICLAGLLVYAVGLRGPFLFDDYRAVLQNPRIRRPASAADLLLRTNRPVVDATLAVNHVLGGDHPLGYRLFNLALHLAVGMLLWTLISETLAGRRIAAWPVEEARRAALAAALIWTVHPLTTQAVSYIVQRAEVLAAFFYLMTLYGILRLARSPEKRVWAAVAVGACALAMGSKETAVTAPVAALLYDRVFLAGSFRVIVRRRGWVHTGLAATWLILVWTTGVPRPEGVSAGWGFTGISPWAYFRTEPGVIRHYLALVFWPARLCFDYGWPVAGRWEDVLPSALMIGGLASLALLQWPRRPGTAFLGTMFFLLLAPTSSVVPIADPAAEHRMYLASAVPILLVVLAAAEVLRRRPGIARLRRSVHGILVLTVAALGVRTALRNMDYRSAVRIWADVLAQRPPTPRACLNYANALAREGRLDEALPYYRKALALDPSYVKAAYNWGMALERMGRVDEASAMLARAVEIDPDFFPAGNAYGRLLMKEGRLDEAVAVFERNHRRHPRRREAANNYGLALYKRGRRDEARAVFEEILDRDPAYAAAHDNLGLIAFEEGRWKEAEGHWRAVLRQRPTYVPALYNLATVRARAGDLLEAYRLLMRVGRLSPGFAETAVRMRQLERSIVGRGPEIRREEKSRRQPLPTEKGMVQ